MDASSIGALAFGVWAILASMAGGLWKVFEFAYSSRLQAKNEEIERLKSLVQELKAEKLTPSQALESIELFKQASNKEMANLKKELQERKDGDEQAHAKIVKALAIIQEKAAENNRLEQQVIHWQREWEKSEKARSEISKRNLMNALGSTQNLSLLNGSNMQYLSGLFSGYSAHSALKFKNDTDEAKK